MTTFAEMFRERMAQAAAEEAERAQTMSVAERVKLFREKNTVDGYTVRVSWNYDNTQAVCEVVKQDGFSAARATIAQGQPIAW